MRGCFLKLQGEQEHSLGAFGSLLNGTHNMAGVSQLTVLAVHTKC